MPRRFTISSLLLFIAVAALACAIYRYLNPPPVYRLPIDSWSNATYNSYILGRNYEVEFWPELFDDYPIWNRRTPNPPVSANRAMVLADRALKRLVKEEKLPVGDDPSGWRLDAAELTPLSDERGHWFWLVRFDADLDEDEGLSEFKLIVLMDGTVIEPTVTIDDD